MNGKDFETLWEAISVLEAQELISLLPIFDWPNMDKAGREKLHSRLYRIAYPKMLDSKPEEIKPDDFAKLLRGLNG